MKFLITGGAGFIGTKLTARLAAANAEVTIVDSLTEQVHGDDAQFPKALTQQAHCVRGDVCDAALMKELLDDADVVVHLAAETGTGQSMYALQRYSMSNMHGTAALLEQLVERRPARLRKLIVASSRAVYGEGMYECANDGVVFPNARSGADMAAGRFEPVCPKCSGELRMLATAEETPFAPSSFYGLTKQVQEQSVLMFGAALGIDAFALRYQNVFGPGQSLVNPYTGILAIFSNLVRQSKPLNIFEDGLESRDFVYIDDVISATVACAADDVHGVMPINVGSGIRTSVREVASAIVEHFGIQVPINVTGQFRIGDIRHNVADVSRLKQVAGVDPAWGFRAGLTEFLRWAEEHEAVDAGFDRSLGELRDRGLLGSRQS